MIARDQTLSGGRTGGLCLVGLLVGLCAASPRIAGGAENDANGVVNPLVAKGEALFRKEWLPGVPSAHGGDGLGPVYNETSCVACHSLGGVGGAGGADKNVHLLTAVVTPVAGEAAGRRFRMPDSLTERLDDSIEKRLGIHMPKPRAKGDEPDRSSLISLHAGFRDASNVVLHRFGTGADYDLRHLVLSDPFRASFTSFGGLFGKSQSHEIAAQGTQVPITNMPSTFGHFTIVHSQLNAPSLFGSGLIASIPDEVLEAAAKQRYSNAWGVRGRVNRLRDGRIGRFGWKAQTATLDDFVLAACAVELGFEVPDRHQGIDPAHADYRSPGLDLTRTECAALTAYVASLPAPRARIAPDMETSQAIEAGRAAFARIGCAACHHERLGNVEGIYSDLLLHDMGNDLADQSSYDASIPDPSEETLPGSFPLAELFPSGTDAFEGGTSFRGPARSEWRTPPLWGLRETGPYLHDGRADTLEQAIAVHGGEASSTATLYFRLPRRDRDSVLFFLKSIGAPKDSAPQKPVKQTERPVRLAAGSTR